MNEAVETPTRSQFLRDLDVIEACSLCWGNCPSFFDCVAVAGRRA